MSMWRFREYRLPVVAIIALCIFLVGSSGVFHLSMNMQTDGQTSGCPFMGQGAICSMNQFEHIAAWQNAFTTTVPEGSIAFLLLLVLFMVLRAWKELFSKQRSPLLQSFHVKYREQFFFPDHLQEAFSNGIINSKVF